MEMELVRFARNALRQFRFVSARAKSFRTRAGRRARLVHYNHSRDFATTIKTQRAFAWHSTIGRSAPGTDAKVWAIDRELGFPHLGSDGTFSVSAVTKRFRAIIAIKPPTGLSEAISGRFFRSYAGPLTIMVMIRSRVSQLTTMI